jgi:hypothetical protein
MSSTKGIYIAIVLLAGIFCLTLYTSCKKKDPCAGVTCLNKGACNGGKCICPTGFEGAYCEITTYVDPCKSVVCLNGGTCDSGTCICPTGYEGTYCETKAANKFIKVWNATDVPGAGSSSSFSYTTSITAGSSVAGIRIIGFSDAFFSNDVTGSVNGSIINLPLQEPDNNGYTVVGTGTYDNVSGKIQWTYTIRNPSFTSLSYSGTWQ